MVGIPDPVYGQKIAAVTVMAQQELADSFTLQDLRSVSHGGALGVPL